MLDDDVQFDATTIASTTARIPSAQVAYLPGSLMTRCVSRARAVIFSSG